VKRSDLVKHLSQNGCVLHREGKKHTLYKNPKTGRYAAVPRHNEVNDFTARKICIDLEISTPKKS